jgi:phosphate transport system protein
MTLSKEDIGHHISGQFNADLQALHTHVLDMSRLVQAQINDATNALLTGNSDLAASVIRRGVEANARELDLDGECTRILVRRQPAAGDLRLIFAVIKTVTDLERIGDQAERVARSAIEHAAESKRRRPTALKRMAALALALLNQSVEAFGRMDSAAALDIARLDVELDQEYESVTRELITGMMEDPRTISWALNLAWAARALERIGDHSKNIAEYVIYMVEGKDVRHIGLEEREKLLLDNRES